MFAQTCENLWKGMARFRRDCSVRTWAYKLAWNAAESFRRDAYRKRVRRLRTTEISEIAEEITTTLSGKIAAKDRLARLTEVLDPYDRSLLLLRVDEGLPWREVAQMMSETNRPLEVAALRKRFERLKIKLHKLAEQEGLLEK